MRVSEFATVVESIDFEDYVLLDLIEEYRQNLEKRQNDLEIRSKQSNRLDYLSLALARLAYEFAREKYDSLCIEAEKRGLVY